MKKKSCKKSRQIRSSSICSSKRKKQAKSKNCLQSSSSQSRLPVTCGYKEGFLDLKKYYKRQKCILSEDRWFTPTEFERFGRKEKNKKWRTSILCKGITLQKLIEDGFLLPKTFMKGRIHGEKQKKRPEVLQQQVLESAEKSNGSQGEDDDDIDMTKFEGATLPVACGSNSGVLHKCRFAGERCGRCIRTENSWLTPEGFIKLNKPDGIWRKDIVSNGVPLGRLIKKKVLELHTINCDCEICQELDQHLNDDVCFVCNSEGNLVCCDECPRAFHHHCHLPAVPEDSSGKWSCIICVLKNMKGSSQKNQQDIMSSPVSQYTQHCQCLLLHLLRECMTDPCTNIPGGSENICGPMMLGRVKQNLENNNCPTVQVFVSDIEYVFHHCTSKRDNDFSRMMSRLMELLETIFKP
nr:Zgc:113411 [Danio rerio]AAI64509.1 Zgc:113411 protein [Danio rerio]